MIGGGRMEAPRGSGRKTTLVCRVHTMRDAIVSVYRYKQGAPLGGSFSAPARSLSDQRCYLAAAALGPNGAPLADEVQAAGSSGSLVRGMPEGVALTVMGWPPVAQIECRAGVLGSVNLAELRRIERARPWEGKPNPARVQGGWRIRSGPQTRELRFQGGELVAARYGDWTAPTATNRGDSDAYAIVGALRFGGLAQAQETRARFLAAPDLTPMRLREAGTTMVLHL